MEQDILFYKLTEKVYEVKKALILILFCIIIFFTSAFVVYADSNSSDSDAAAEIMNSIYEDSGAEDLMYKLPESARTILNDMNIRDFSPQSTQDLTMGNFFQGIVNVLRDNIYEPLKVLMSVLGIVFLSASFNTLKNSGISSALDSMIDLISVLCIVAVLAPGIFTVIESAVSVIEASSSFMLLYIPVISVLIFTGGQQLSAMTFYSSMIYISNLILQITSKILLPILKCILALSVVSSVSNNVSLEGFISLFKKAVKLIICFLMSLFTAFITMKSIVSVSEDTISNKVVKFAINNFVPLVGGALSDAYQTVVSCVGILKSGVGVAAMVAIFTVFLPGVFKCIVWQGVVLLGSAVCDVFGIKQTSTLLSSFAVILSTVSAVMISVMVIYIVSTAIILIVGG